MIVHAYYPADETRVKREAEFLAKKGIRVDVICLKDQDQAWTEKVGGVSIFRIPVSRHRKSGPLVYALEYAAFGFFSALLVTILFARRRYRLIEVNTLPDPLIFGAFVPKIFGAKLILNMHETTPDLMMERLQIGRDHWFTRLIVWFERISVRYADAVVTVSDPVREIIQDRTGRKDIGIVMNVADDSIFRSTLSQTRRRISASVVSVAYHGLIARSYDLRPVLRALTTDNFPIDRVHLQVYGSGPLELELKDLTKALGLESRVTYHGFVRMEEVAELVAEADIGVVPVASSYYADFALPTKLLEYVALHIPVVVPRFKTICSYFSEEMVAYYDPGDNEGLARALSLLVKDPESRERFAEQAETFNTMYNWPQQSEAYMKILQSTLNNPDTTHGS